MEKIKVLIVDDSAVIRKVLGDFLAADPDIEIVGTAPNGKVALERIQDLKPDIVTLDIEMPEMDGLETVQHIRKRDQRIPIIMCSSLTEAGAAVTLDALAFGASDYVTKPSSHGVNTREVVGDELLRKIKGLAGNTSSVAASPSPSPSHVVRGTPAPHLEKNANVIAIGVSTGGPNALAAILPDIPAHLAVPILIVQHMPPLFTALLAERLNGVSQLPVSEAQHGQEIKPGYIYLAPGGQHMEVKRLLGRNLISLNENPPENSCRPAVDVLFRSVAAVYGPSSLAVVLTGMGQDGVKGCEVIRRAGGRVLAQDRETSAVWGMPGAVIEAGLATDIIPLRAVAQEIRRGNEIPAVQASERSV